MADCVNKLNLSSKSNHMASSRSEGEELGFGAVSALPREGEDVAKVDLN